MDDESTNYEWMEAFDECLSCGASGGWCTCDNTIYEEDGE